MPRVKSQSESHVGETRQFFVPGGAETLLYLIVGAIILAGLNVGSLITQLTNHYILDPENLKANFDNFLDAFSNSFSSALGGRLGQILLWSVVGAIAYIGIWLAKNILNSFENDIIADHYLHPAAYDRLGYWSSSLSVKSFLTAIVLITAGFIYISVTAVLPAVAVLAGSAAYNFQFPSSALYIAFSVVGTALVLYIGVRLMRLIAHLWKLL